LSAGSSRGQTRGEWLTVLARLERALEQVVEGSIAGLFRLRVQPAEIGRQLERAMLDGRTAAMGTSLAPNLFEVRLHPDDASAFAGWEAALAREMESWLAELAFARGLSTVGAIRVRIEADARVPRRSVRAAGRFAATDAAELERSAEVSPRLCLRPSESRFPSHQLDAAVVCVGRAADNDLVLPDPEVSRHHARLFLHGTTWRVVDLGSTNGTRVNGERVRQAVFTAGDTIDFAGVRMTVASA
jgi:hypothetical protein